jgi:hypothetical protein
MENIFRKIFPFAFLKLLSTIRFCYLGVDFFLLEDTWGVAYSIICSGGFAFESSWKHQNVRCL